MQELDKVYLPMFEGTIVNGKMRSIASGKPTGSTSGSTEVSACAANGTGWQLDDWSNTQMVKDLLILLSKSTNVQEKYGQGHTTGGSSASSFLDCGSLKNKGEFWGSSGTTSAVKFFWLENWFGDRWDRKYGCVTDSSRNVKVKMYPPYNTDGSGYTVVTSNSANLSGWSFKTQINEYGEIPISVGGDADDSKYQCDYVWLYPGSFLGWGGDCSDGSDCGFYVLLFDAFSVSSWSRGSSVSYK